jgi:hypothetical protein
MNLVHGELMYVFLFVSEMVVVQSTRLTVMSVNYLARLGVYYMWNKVLAGLGSASYGILAHDITQLMNWLFSSRPSLQCLAAYMDKSRTTLASVYIISR